MTDKRRGIRVKLFSAMGLCVAMIALTVLLGAVLVGAGEPGYSEGLEYTSKGDGTCTVSGIGTCTDTEVVIPSVSPAGDTVTGIGYSAFSGCSCLTSITIPEGVRSINSNAFSDCSSLKSITIPEGVTEVGHAVFLNCTGLTHVSLPESAKSIGGLAFEGCTNLKNITIPAGVKSIGNYAFKDCKSLTEIVIPDGVTSIGDYTFQGCTGLTNVTIPESVTVINNNAFSACVNLTSIQIPSGVTRLTKSVFQGCTKLIQKENGVSYVDRWVVDCDQNVTNVVLRADTVGICDSVFADYVSLASITIPDGVTHIPQYAFKNCSKLQSVVLPDNVKSIGFAAFSGCSSLMSVTIPDGLTVLDRCAFQNCTALKSFRVPGGVETIGWYAFSGCTSLTSVSLSDGLKTIEQEAFRKCGRLTSIDLPNTLTFIGGSAFSDCVSLTSIKIPESMTKVYDSVFSGCTGVTSVIIPDSVTEIGNGTFCNCTNLKSIVIPKSVTKIGRSAFAGCSRLTGVVLQDGLQSIGENAFSKCIELTDIVLPTSVQTVGANAFQGCKKLIRMEGGVSYVDCWAIDCESTVTEARLRNDTVGIADSAFRYCGKLKSVTIPASVKNIGSAAFASCKSLTAVMIPTGVTNILNQTFKDCSSLRSVTLSDGIEGIGSEAFCNCTALTSIILPDSVRGMGNDAFRGCTGLTSVKLSDGMTYFNGSAFYGCNSLTGLRIPESVIGVANGWCVGGDALELVQGVYYVDTWVVGTETQNPVIREGTVGIGDFAFECFSMTSMVIPSSLKYIGDFSFDGILHTIGDIYYLGTKQDWNAITFGSCNATLGTATYHYLGDLFDLTSASLTLGDSLTMNYYAKADPAYGTPAMRFTYRGKTETVRGIPTETEGEYVFSLKGIAPQCMGEAIKAELLLIREDGAEFVVDTKESYSVRQYCDDALAANPDNKALATLLADLLAYGDAAQDYTDFNADTPVSEGFSVAPSDWEDVTVTDFTLTDKTREDVRFISAGVRFDYVNRLYFKIKAADPANVTLTVGDKTYTVKELELAEDTDGTYILYTDPIYATAFDKVFTAELSADGEVIQTLTYSVRSYVCSKQNSENTEIAALVRALYRYGRSAIAYKNAQ